MKSALSGRYGPGFDPTKAVKLNPKLRYLRVQLPNSQPALLVLGYVDPAPGGPVEVWYSSSGELLRLQSGRIVGTAGLPFDWPRVWFDPSPPPWKDAGKPTQKFVRYHDERPGYRAGQRQVMRLLPTAEPLRQDWPAKLPFANYRWYTETSDSIHSVHVPNSVYAIDEHDGQSRVVYSEQCLSPDWCFKIQAWPPGPTLQ